MQIRNKLLAFTGLAAAIVSFSTLSSEGDGETDTSSTEYVVNRAWIERMPTNHKDMVGHLLFLDQPGSRHRLGSVGRSSQWRHVIEIFKWALEADRMSVVFPQSDMKGKLVVRSWRCAGEAPKPFELCLELSSGDRKVMFYSRDDWEVTPHDSRSGLNAMREHVPGLAPGIEQALQGAVDNAVSDDTFGGDTDDAPELVLERIASGA